MTAGATIKKLYEGQRNTNPFDDIMKMKLLSLDSTIQRNNDQVVLPQTAFKLPLIDEIKIEQIPNQHATMCFDNDGNVIYVCRFNNTIKHYTLPVYEPYIELKINTDDDSVSLNFELT